MEDHNLPWTESGIKLMQTINSIITTYGGIEAYTELIKGEVELTTHQNHIKQLYKSFDKVIKYKILKEDAAELLGMNRSEYEKQYYKYKSKLNSESNNPNSDP